MSDAFGSRVDVLVGLRGLDAQAFSRTLQVPFHGSTLDFIGREDFIAMKVFAGGPIDLQDADMTRPTISKIAPEPRMAQLRPGRLHFIPDCNRQRQLRRICRLAIAKAIAYSTSSTREVARREDRRSGSAVVICVVLHRR